MIGETLDETSIKAMSKNKFKKYVKQKIQSAAFKYLIELKNSHSAFRAKFIFLCLDMLSYNNPVFATNFSSSLQTCDTMRRFNGKCASSNRSIVTI